MVGIDVLIGLSLYFHLSLLQNVIMHIFQFLQVGVRLISREAFLKHLSEVSYLLFIVLC